ncbi:hypothetical protein CTI14_63655, partial [Methylobacterium radiotolerans]
MALARGLLISPRPTREGDHARVRRQPARRGRLLPDAARPERADTAADPGACRPLGSRRELGLGARLANLPPSDTGGRSCPSSSPACSPRPP